MMPTLLASDRSLASLPGSKNRFVVIAHRGGVADAPENSLAALRSTVRVGADYMEVDLRTTADGAIVAMHDPTVDRTTTGSGFVADMTLAELRQLRIQDCRFSGRPLEPVPTLEEMLPVARINDLKLYLDCHDAEPGPVYRLLRRYGMERWVVVYSDPESCACWKMIAPEIPLVTSPPRTVTTPAELETFWRRYPVEILDGPWTLYTTEMIDASRPWGAVIWADSHGPFESESHWRNALNLGVVGLQTDRPAELIALLKAQGRR